MNYNVLLRNNCVREWVEKIEKHDGGLKDFSQAYKYYGLHFQQDNSVIAREWAPGAVALYLTGDFNNWQWEANAFTKLDFGKWEIKIPANADGSCAIHHLSEVKVIVRTRFGQLVSRLSPWAKYVVQPPKELNQGSNYKQIIWNPPPHDVRRIFIYDISS